MALAFAADRKNTYVYPWYIADITATKDLESIIGLNIARTFLTVENDFTTMYYDDKTTDEVGAALLKKILADRSFFGSVVSNLYGRAEELKQFCEQSARDTGKKSEEELLEMYSTYTEKLRALRTWGWVPAMMDGISEPFLSAFLMERLRSHLEPLGRAEKTAEYYSLLSSSEKESEVQKEELARLALLVAVQAGENGEQAFALIKAGDEDGLRTSYPDIYRQLTAHTQEFGALTYGYSGPPVSVAYLLSVLKDDLKQEPVKRVKEIHAHFRDIKVQKSALAEELKLPEELRFALEVASELMYMKDWRKGAYQRSYWLMDAVMEELAKRLQISLKEIKYMTLDDVREMFGGDREAWRAKLKERLLSCCALTEHGITKVYEGAECEKLKAELLPKKFVSTGQETEIKGLVAYPGFVRGTVKIVLTVEDMAKLNDGDILVSSSTNPDLIVAMKRAGAFITDIGGITSHAAIVSRELKKPCIVGTKNATHVLKDGDTVEVDAKAGVVTIVSRA
ncbi:MAG: PEP-utilizing enzyme [Patescibacteria group bacterium]